MSCSVSGKIKCVYKTSFAAEAASAKRTHQSYKVTASEELCPEFIVANSNAADAGAVVATEKVDGTCCIIKEFQGRPWLWARHDVKPNKNAEKRFRDHQKSILNSHTDSSLSCFVWDVAADFREVPEDWVWASRDSEKDLRPDDNGHLVGWVPVDPSLRTHAWHLSAVDLAQGYGLFLTSGSDGTLSIRVDRLEEYLSRSVELIGTCVNANPYGLGSKKHPFHVLVRHGSLIVPSPPSFDHHSVKAWFGEPDGQVEGIVWHFPHGQMYKLHRCHLDVKWPVPNPKLSLLQVTVDCALDGCPVPTALKGALAKICKMHGRAFSSLATLGSEVMADSP